MSSGAATVDVAARAAQFAHRPPAHLLPYVESAVGYRYIGFAPGVHQGLPSRHLSVVISFDTPVDMVAMPDPTQPPTRLTALAGGLHAAPVSIRHDGNQHGVQLQLTPLGARALFGVPAGELASIVVSLDDVLAHAGELVDRLVDTSSWRERFTTLDVILSRALERDGTAGRPRPEVAFAFDRLAQTGGSLPVGQLASEVGWSRRHLTNEFGRELGLTPKTVARVLRFERSRWLMVDPDRRSIADVAARCGYADQAHMARDWVELAGSSPRSWLADEVFPFVQDGDEHDRSRWPDE